MAKISLRAYNREIDDLIEQGHRLDEAVAHCLHILRTFPKHLETYRRLGKAYLEAKRYDQAVDIFQRILVAVPEDFVSHVGMSIIADDQAKLDEAIWHMERAFEVQPSNAAIQGELQRLFGRRDGVEPPKIRLTRGALAHMYVQGELYAQAISEIRAVLAHDPNRTDMQVLLARAYARSGQKAEAAEVCAALLAISPYCLDANRLMAEGLSEAPESDAAREYRRRAIELDPYGEFAQGSVFEADQVSDGAVTMQRLEYTGRAPESAGAPALSLDAAIGETERATAVPSWLAETSAAPSRPPAPSAPPIAGNVPDFMSEAGWREASGAALGESDNASEGAELEPEASLGDLPEWVRALAPGDEADRRARAEAQTVQTDDWLSDARNATGEASDELPAVTAADHDEPPGWLKDLAQSSAASFETSTVDSTPAIETQDAARLDSDGPDATAGLQDDGLAWLEGLAEKHGAKPEELITRAGARPSGPPAWADEPRKPDVSKPGTFRDSILGGDVGPGTTETPAAPDSTTPEEKPFDWLSGLSEPDTFSGIQAPSTAEEALSFADGPSASEAPSPVRPGDQLFGRDAGRGDMPSPVGREPSGEYESEVDLPDWLADLDGVKPPGASQSEPAVDASALPEWLRVPDEAAAAAPPADTQDWRRADLDLDSAAQDLKPAAARPAFNDERRGNLAPARASSQVNDAPRTEALPARPRAVPEPQTAEMPSLSGAKAELGRGNIGAALELYGRLIRRGRSLEEVIRDLRDALYRYPVEVPIWQALGDAYMRANRLQEALDAYTKAEELLR